MELNRQLKLQKHILYNFNKSNIYIITYDVYIKTNILWVK